MLLCKENQIHIIEEIQYETDRLFKNYFEDILLSFY